MVSSRSAWNCSTSPMWVATVFSSPPSVTFMDKAPSAERVKLRTDPLSK